ncbi:MAG: hypothetical protein EHM91_15980 [Planctomycetota bacterium]|nr:MAG: hypothetical protein EHM91_15980 [Planctomycetota bacterium]
MRKNLVLLAAIAVCNTAGTCDLTPPDSVLRAEITPEELEAAPGYNQMKGALLNDIRVWRELDKKVAVEGRREVPTSLSLLSGVATCGTDQTEFEIYRLKEELQDQPYRVDETAYLCRKEGVYYYHYQGGPRKLDVWMGPYRIDRKRVKPDPK